MISCTIEVVMMESKIVGWWDRRRSSESRKVALVRVVEIIGGVVRVT